VDRCTQRQWASALSAPGGLGARDRRRSRVLNPCRHAITLEGLLALATVGVFIGSGCAKKETRISLDELNTLEAEAVQVEPVELQTEDLALTELHPYTVGVNDILNVTLTGPLTTSAEQYTQFALTLRVHDDGTIMLPMGGRIKVAGLDLRGVEKALYDAHVPKYVKDMSVFVQLGGPEQTTVLVVGAAGESGLVQLPRNERNVLYALARAAGFSPAGSGRVHIRPARPDRPQLTYDLTDINDLRRALIAPPLESGDMVVVESAETSAVYVTGLVNVPGPIPVPPKAKLSLVRAVAAAGGLRDFLDPQEATLWRTLDDGEQVRVKLALADVMTGKVPDVDLLPGDVLDVPHTAATRFREWFAANIRIGPFGVTAMYDPVADYRARLLRDRNDDNYYGRTLLGTLSTGLSELLVPPAPTAP
jgi:protein involved in polysaccharide export with SLBB domain